MPDVSRYLQRVSALLREGRPVNDVALYLPTSDALGDIKPGTAHLLELLRERIGPAVPAAILDAGYGFDVVDDGALAAPASIQGERAGHRRAALPHGGAAGGAHDAGRDGCRGCGRSRPPAAASSRPIACPRRHPGCAASRSPSTCR